MMERGEMNKQVGEEMNRFMPSELSDFEIRLEDQRKTLETELKRIKNKGKNNKK